MRLSHSSWHIGDGGSSVSSVGACQVLREGVGSQLTTSRRRPSRTLTRSTRPSARIVSVAVSVLASLGLSAPAFSIKSKSELLHAPVPTACEHPAGRLVNGVLPGVPESQGGAGLDRRNVVLGRLVPGGGRGAAAGLLCSRGGVGWPEVLVFYDERLKLIHHVDLFSVAHGGRESLRRLSLANGVTTVQVQAIAQPGDVGCCGTASALLRFAWNAKRKRIALTSRTMYTERAAAKAFIDALRAGDANAARRYAAPPVVSEVFANLSNVRRTARLGRCVGVLTDPAAGGGWVDDGRGCEITIQANGIRFTSIGLHMTQSSWRTWRATQWDLLGR